MPRDLRLPTLAAALTLLKRVGFQAVTGIVADDDDDGNEASSKPPDGPKTDARPKSAPTAKGTIKDEPVPPHDPKTGEVKPDAQEIAARMLADCAQGFASPDDRKAWALSHTAAKKLLPKALQTQIEAAFHAAPTTKVPPHE